MDKRAARREYKEKKTPIGVFAIRCSATGEVWVSASNHLDSARTSTWFQLRSGRFPNQQLLSAWNTHGEEAFKYEVLETIDTDDVSPLGFTDLLRERQDHWRKELKAGAV